MPAVNRKAALNMELTSHTNLASAVCLPVCHPPRIKGRQHSDTEKKLQVWRPELIAPGRKKNFKPWRLELCAGQLDEECEEVGTWEVTASDHSQK
jgi:hypothetical protein